MKSLLFVPSIPKMLSKISEFEADAFIIDLEDSIKEADKKRALEDTCVFLSDTSIRNIYIRLDNNHMQEELDRLSSFTFRGYMLPKYETSNDYQMYESYFKNKEIIALIETPAGVINLDTISKSVFVNMLAFGGEDFTSSIGMKNCSNTLMYARSAIVTYGKAYNKPVFDTPSFAIEDTTSLCEDIQLAVDMGFDGKMAIHPKQISFINKLFQYYDIEKIQSIVEQYDKAGMAVLKIGDHVYEKMHIAHYKRILKENRKEGNGPWN